jgi:hypothetical protein
VNVSGRLASRPYDVCFSEDCCIGLFESPKKK